MSIDWGYTVAPDDGGGDIAHALAEANAPRHGDRTPREWIRANLFNNWYNSIITIVFGAIALYGGYYALRFLFSTAQWNAVADNLELFMLGVFPRQERTRIVVQLLMMSGAIGLLVGYFRARARQVADEAGVELVPVTVRETVSTYGSIAVFVGASLAIGARTLGPYLLVVGLHRCRRRRVLRHPPPAQSAVEGRAADAVRTGCCHAHHGVRPQQHGGVRDRSRCHRAVDPRERCAAALADAQRRAAAGCRRVPGAERDGRPGVALPRRCARHRSRSTSSATYRIDCRPRSVGSGSRSSARSVRAAADRRRRRLLQRHRARPRSPSL